MGGRARRTSLPNLVLLVALVCGYAQFAPPIAQSAQVAGAGATLDRYDLSPSSPVAEQMFAPDPASARGQTFLQIEVTSVDNPNRIPLSLTVQVEAPRRGRFYLGSVRLDPADKPDTLLVATQGLLEDGGAVRVTLLPLREARDDDAIRVRLKPFALVKR